MNVHVLRLSPGDDLRAALEASFASLAREHGIAAACIVSAVGSLSQATLRYADRPGGSDIQGPLELLMVSGTLSPDGAHLHVSVADADGAVTGFPCSSWGISGVKSEHATHCESRTLGRPAIG